MNIFSRFCVWLLAYPDEPEHRGPEHDPTTITVHATSYGGLRIVATAGDGTTAMTFLREREYDAVDFITMLDDLVTEVESVTR